MNSQDMPNSAGGGIIRGYAPVWDDVELHHWFHYSGEMGDRVYRVRRVRMAGNRLFGLARVEWWNPEEFGTDYEWTEF